MEALQVAITSVLSAVVLFFMTKLMGYKQLSHLSIFDYVTSITIGSIAAEFATSLEKNPLLPFIAIMVYFLFDILISAITNKSLKLRKFITGKPFILMHNGQIFRKALIKAKLDINDFLSICRISGYFDIDQIRTAIMEPSGNISILPYEAFRPSTPSDMSLTPEQTELPSILILDGHILDNNLKAIGKNRDWLVKLIKQQGYPSHKTIFLAFCNSKYQISAYPMDYSTGPKAQFE